LVFAPESGPRLGVIRHVTLSRSAWSSDWEKVDGADDRNEGTVQEIEKKAAEERRLAESTRDVRL
jgi:hypothetical protein